MDPSATLAMVLTAVALVVSVVTDLRSRKILNVVTLPAMLAGLALHLVAHGWDGGGGLGLKWSLIGLVAGGLPFLLFSAFDPRAFGMGDVKLMAAVGALMGWPFILRALVYTAVVGGVFAILVLLWKGRLVGTLGGMAGRLFRRSGAGDGPDPAREGKKGEREKREEIYIPYGVAIAGGTFWAIALDLYRQGIL